MRHSCFNLHVVFFLFKSFHFMLSKTLDAHSNHLFLFVFPLFKWFNTVHMNFQIHFFCLHFSLLNIHKLRFKFHGNCICPRFCVLLLIIFIISHFGAFISMIKTYKNSINSIYPLDKYSHVFFLTPDTEFCTFTLDKLI